MRLKIALLLITFCFFIAGCGENASRLPFPTPAQHDLVVLTQAGPLTYSNDDNGNGGGLERDLIETFAQELGVGVKYIVAQPNELADRLNRSDYHIAAAWLSPSSDPQTQATPPIFQTRDLLAQHDASLPLTEVAQLGGKTVHAMAGTRQAETLRRLAREIPELKVVEVGQGDVLDLLESLGNGKVEYAVMDANLEDIASQFVPTLRTTLNLSLELPIVWQLGRHPNVELAARASAFIERVQRDGTLARLEDRYFGHVHRLNQGDVVKFLGEIETTLPKLRKHFHVAESITGIDWRLIAAVAYHESHWDANATSYTNVRGIMMLTEETADRLGVSNRLDPRESIVAGARYINLLKDQQSEDVAEPDRTWLALAAYNIGPGHFNAARRLAKHLGADAGAWFEMKRILPLLAQPKYYEKIKSSRARGGEAVILVENIRSYYDILVRHEPAAQAAPPRLSLQGETRGLHLKR
ncbi:membrane-bound lytic murein transglycosylase MltF [Dechloromonas hortensis]|uniref:membrane-bound lytic murein transglycosylase MltF n=1 Tax=Dechloromonas hortensis TaxID=337779 RepID=UPI001292477C|nr:membrane-bound lytic murein transglycosylase MltF [Dechloromonas hortensis]